MDEKIKNALKTSSKFHDDLLAHCKARVEMSRAHMSQHYDLWDANDATIRGQRLQDEQDRKAVKRGEPEKMVLPFTYAQVQTFIAFFCLLFNQRSFFYEIEDNGEGDITPEGDAQTILDKDLSRNKFQRILYQAFLDIARSGFCVIKSAWSQESVTTKQPTVVEAQDTFATGAVATQTQSVTKFKKQGNKLTSISPYKFFPDVRFPLSRLQDGEFCASEDDFSKTRLRQMEADGMIVNVDDIGVVSSGKGEKPVVNAGARRLLSFMFNDSDPRSGGKGNTTLTSAGSEGSGMVIVTECEIWISPKEFQDESGSAPFGNESKPEMFVVSYANDHTIIRAEKMNYDHNQFCYDVGEYSADQLKVINESLAEIVDPLQAVATWFLNSRITSVRKNIDNKFVVDPSGLEMDDLKNRSPIVRLKPGMARSGVDNWIKQLQVTDVTANHVNDVTTLWTFMQVSTGINDNTLGQYNTGRRSATESRTVNSGAASRLKTVASVLWETLFIPLGEKMLSNLGNNLSIEIFQKYIGKMADQTRFDTFKSELDGYTFEFFDGTAPSEKGYIAQSMQDLLLGLLSNPITVQMLGMEPFRSLVVEIADLRGIRSPERFLPPPTPTNTNGQPQLVALGPPAGSTPPKASGTA